MKFAFAVAAASIVAHAASPLSPDDAMKSFQLADPALRIELVAAEPLVESPCAIAFDERGRMFVAENRGYPRTMDPPQGRIALLEDTDNDGRMDKRTAFAEGLIFPNGVMPWKGGVIVTCAPDVLFLKDNDGDGKADERTVLLTGFETKGSTQLRVNCPTLGPDGWIYFAAGLSGGEITVPGSGKPPVKMTGDLRWHPITGEIENVDGRSQFGMSFDYFGRRFICMNRVPVQHVVLQSKWLRRNPHLAFSDTVHDCNERTVTTGLKGGGDGVRLFPISSNITTADSHAGSFSAACGITIWRSYALGPRLAGCALSCDPTANLVHADSMLDHEDSFRASPIAMGQEFLASRDDWFRPVFLAIGPNDALYVADMYRKVIEHPDYLPEEVRKNTDFEAGKTMGRIWRIVPRRPTLTGPIPKFAEASPAGLVAFGRGKSIWEWDTAFRLMHERRDPALIDEIFAVFSDNSVNQDTYRFVHVLGALGALDDARLAWLIGEQEAATSYAALELAAGKTGPGSRVRMELLRLDVFEHGELLHARLLGEVDDPAVFDKLIELATEASGLRWRNAIIAAAIGGREMQFLKHYADKLRSRDDEPKHSLPYDLLRQIGQSIAGAVTQKDFAETASTIVDMKIDALLAGFGERVRSRKLPVKLDLLEDDDDRLENAEDTLGESTSPVDECELAIGVLALGSFDRAGKPLLEFLITSSDIKLHAAAAKAFANFEHEGTARLLLQPEAWDKFSPHQRENILSALLEHSKYRSEIVGLLEDGVLSPGSIGAAQRQILRNEKDLRARAEKLFGAIATGDRKKAFEDAKAALALKADSKHGRELFKTQCATCHRLDREGHGVGPDLLDMRNQPKESILFHIVVPDAEVAPAFAAYLAETNDGRTIIGILASETPTSITLRGPLAQETSLLRSEIKKLEALPNSLMPAGVETAMSRQDLADLIAYLKGEGE